MKQIAVLQNGVIINGIALPGTSSVTIEELAMLAIRLARFGAKKKPTYRVVVIDKDRARNSRSVEVVGFYNPVAKPAAIQLDHERIQHWMKQGAQPSDTVARLLRNHPAPEPATAAT